MDWIFNYVFGECSQVHSGLINLFRGKLEQMMIVVSHYNGITLGLNFKVVKYKKNLLFQDFIGTLYSLCNNYMDIVAIKISYLLRLLFGVWKVYEDTKPHSNNFAQYHSLKVKILLLCEC